jgi:hypothetical protein
MTAVMAMGILASGRPAVPQDNNDEKLHITAWAVNMSNIGTGATAMVDFTPSSGGHDPRSVRS